MATLLLVALVVIAVLCLAASSTPRREDLSDAVIVVKNPSGDVQERKAVELLADEVQRRAALRWAVASEPPRDRPAIILTTDGGGAPEGYSLEVESTQARPAVIIRGNDVRGRLFGIGRLLRAIHFAPGKVEVDADLQIRSAPQVPVRGHQLGYRPKSHSYDAWDKARFEQYIRDLIIFGANAIEIIPSIAPDDISAKNEIMPVDPWEMTLWLAQTIHDYGLLVCVWLPIIEQDILTPEGRRAALERRRALFEACAHIDSVFVPGGDPGHLHPRDFFPVVAEQASLLKRIHPRCEMWISPQNFRGEALEYFYAYLRQEQPRWLDGVVYGPWVEDSVQHMRQVVPPRYPLRHYPDVCHTIRCQYPVPNWDQAFAITANREPVCPRPTQFAHIHNLYADYALGFITYSDGIGDDVNKFIWNAMGWDRGADVRQALSDYARTLISQQLADEIAHGILALERNWSGPLEHNQQIHKTLAQWQALERKASSEVLADWRFQQNLLRAYFDAYVQARLRFERDLEREALRALAAAETTGADQAMAAARSALARADRENANPQWRARIDALADDLWRSIGAQLTVERHHAQAWDRGAMVTTRDLPLNNRRWIEAELRAVAPADERAKLAAIRRILEWEDPGPGGSYDNLGQRWSEPHLVTSPGWEADPGFVCSAQDEFDAPGDGRLSWQCQAQTLFGTPLRMRYEGLDPAASYRLRITYAGRYRAQARLVANQRWEIHGPLGPSNPIAPIEFEVPRQATAGGVLELTWHRVTGRGVQVAEVWLLKR